MQPHVTAPAAPSTAAGPSRRSWWSATKHAWANPAEWRAWQVILLLGLVALLALLALWATSPGGPLGPPEPLSTSPALVSQADGRFVYRLLEPPAGKARTVATLQALYDAHKDAAAGRPVTLLLLRRAAPISPYIMGTGNSGSQDVLGSVIVGPEPERREAAVRPSPTAPLQPVDLRW